MTLLRHYLTELNRPYKRTRRYLRFTQIGLTLWALLAVIAVWMAAESIIQPPLNLTGEEAMLEEAR